MFKIKFRRQNVYFGFFDILRINGMVPFCNLFMERPSYLRGKTHHHAMMTI